MQVVPASEGEASHNGSAPVFSEHWPLTDWAGTPGGELRPPAKMSGIIHDMEIEVARGDTIILKWSCKSRDRKVYFTGSEPDAINGICLLGLDMIEYVENTS